MHKRVLYTLVAALSFLWTSSLWADSQVRIVRLSYVDGDVQIDRADTQGFSAAFLNMPITEGVRVWTRGDAHAELEFEDGSIVRLVPNTLVNVHQLRLHQDHRLTVLGLQYGQIYLNLNKHIDDFRVQVGQQELVPHKSTHFRLSADQDNDVSLAVFRGEVAFFREDGQGMNVRKNQSLSINLTTRQYYLTREITPDAQDGWDRQREEDASVNFRNAYNGYSSAYSYGSSDLYRYGSFSYIFGYGQVWRPYDVSYGWDPFSDGYWVFYPGQGYVWVSPYQWGWTPYRYGSWIDIPGQGWCWQAGNNWNRWSPTPVYVNPPNQFVPPVPPPPTSGVRIVQVGTGGGVMGPRLTRGQRSGASFSNAATSSSSPVRRTAPAMQSPDRHAGYNEVDRSDRTTAINAVRPASSSPSVFSPGSRISRSDRAVNPPMPVVSPQQRSTPAPVVPVQQPVRVFSPPAERPTRMYSPPAQRPTRMYSPPPAPAMRPSAPAMRPMSQPPPPPPPRSAPPAARTGRDGR